MFSPVAIDWAEKEKPRAAESRVAQARLRVRGEDREVRAGIVVDVLELPPRTVDPAVNVRRLVVRPERGDLLSVQPRHRFAPFCAVTA
jgi:hypothetical protein